MYRDARRRECDSSSPERLGEVRGRQKFGLRSIVPPRLWLSHPLPSLELGKRMTTRGGWKSVGRPSGPNSPPISSGAVESISDMQSPSTCTDEANHRPPCPLPSPQASRVDLRQGRATPRIPTRCSMVSLITSQIPLLRRRLPFLFNAYRDRVCDHLGAIAPINFPCFGQIQIAASEIFVSVSF
jgi:hypothetical protein